MAFSVGEEELYDLDTTNLVGHLAAWNYCQSAKSEPNDSFIKACKDKMGDDRVTNDPMEAHYIGFNMWVEAATTDVDAVRKSMYGLTFPNLTGGVAEMLPNHHLAKLLLIGEIQEDGQFDIISQIGEVIGYLRTQQTMAILLVEQYFDFAFGLADQIFAMMREQIVYESPTATIYKARLRQSVGV